MKLTPTIAGGQRIADSEEQELPPTDFDPPLHEAQEMLRNGSSLQEDGWTLLAAEDPALWLA